MRVVYAALPRPVRCVLLDDTLVVSDDLPMLALPVLPIFLAATVAATIGAHPDALLTLLTG